MSSQRESSFETTSSPQQVLSVARSLFEEKRFQIVSDAPEGTMGFRTRKTLLSWELDGLLTAVPAGAGSQVTVAVDTVEGRPKALLDGKKNEKTVAKLAEELKAAVG